MKSKIELTLPKLNTVKDRLERRKIVYKTPRSRKMRSHGIDGVFTKGDLVGVYNLTEKRIYYILGRGRAERIIDSLFSQGHKLLQFIDVEKNTRYFKPIEPGSQKYRGHTLYWEPSSKFSDFFLCGALESRVQEDGTYMIGRRDMFLPHPCDGCQPETIAESVVKCPQLNYPLKLAGCVKLYNMTSGKARQTVRNNRIEPTKKE